MFCHTALINFTGLIVVLLIPLFGDAAFGFVTSLNFELTGMSSDWPLSLATVFQRVVIFTHLESVKNFSS